MTTFLQCVIAIITFCWAGIAAADKTLNIYTWAGEIPRAIILQFEKETGIKVTHTTFDSNEMMLTKLRATQNKGYDLIEPSSYYIDRMRKQGLLEKLDKTKLSNYKNLDPLFLNTAYDPRGEYSIPLVWGITGIFLNQDYFAAHQITQWSDLFDKKYYNQLLFLDDAREVFSMALRMLSYSINDTNPEHIHQAYLKLKELMPNIRLFNSSAVASILIDEDATIGMAWNGDMFKAYRENKKLHFTFPKDGFEIWVDNFALLKNAEHKENAYTFLNFIMRPDIAKEISSTITYSTANLEARKLMAPEIRNNMALYPTPDIMQHGEFQTDIGEKTLALYEKYWEKLKIGA